jgi:hypothetical protein
MFRVSTAFLGTYLVHSKISEINASLHVRSRLRYLYKISNKPEFGGEILLKKNPIQNFTKIIPATTDVFHTKDERKAHVAKLRVVFRIFLGSMHRKRLFQLHV